MKRPRNFKAARPFFRHLYSPNPPPVIPPPDGADEEHSPAFPSLSLLLFLPLLATPMELVLAILALVTLLVGSALVSGSEVAFFSLTHNDFARLGEETGNKPAERILELKERPRTLLATILISNNFINIAIVLLSDYVLGELLPVTTYQSWAEALHGVAPRLATIEQLRDGLSFTITVVGVTSLLLLFGEVAPKVYSKLNNVKMAKLMAGPLSFLLRLFAPLSTLLVRGTGVIERRLASNQNSNVPTREDIDEAIDLTVDSEQNAREVDILKSIVKFGDVPVKQIMRARVDVSALDVDMSYHEMLRDLRKAGYSRMPVYRDDFDTVIGILFVKDLVLHLDEPDDFTWQQLIRDNVYYVPEAKKIDVLLREFQSERLHMAIVVDEYGGSAGIVTLEDIMEEVIGEIRDEFDAGQDIEFEKLDEYTYVFEGKTMLNDVCRIVGVDTSEFDVLRGDADSVAGLLLEVVGYIPRKGREILLHDYRFRVESVNKRRVEKVRVVLPRE